LKWINNYLNKQGRLRNGLKLKKIKKGREKFKKNNYGKKEKKEI